MNSVLGTKIFLCYSPETRSKQITVASVIRADFCSLKKSITFFKIQSNPALRSPHYYEQFALSLDKKALTFSLNSTRVIRTVQGTKRAFTTQGSLNTSLIIESCTLSIFPQQHNRIEFGVSSLANKLHLASKNLQNKHLITVGTGFGNTRAPKTHHTMRNSRRLARYKAHGFFLATRRHWDALTKHAGRINYKTEWNGLGKQKKMFSCWGLASTRTLSMVPSTCPY